MGTAIANVEGRVEVQRLVEEQAALRRVATLVARGVEPAEIFSAVSDEVAQLFAANGLVLRFEEDGQGIVSVGVSAGNDIPAGTRWEFEEGMASLEVYRTGRSARVDAFDWSSRCGPAAKTAERVGIVSSVSNPILVQSRLWGSITVFSTSERLPDETKDRLERFSQLVATAIANAESREAVSRTRDALERVAAEQAALRRVATLVARDAAPAEVFSAVTQEVARVFSRVEAPLVATVIRFDPGPECVLVGASRAYEREPIGSRWEPRDLYVSARVLRTGCSARVDEVDLDAAGGPDADVLRLRGFLYQVGSPVVVEGRLWGAMTLNSSEALPADTDESLENFTELIATAIANAESSSARTRLADEQAALQRVATLVAQGAARTAIFAAVSCEVDHLFRLDPQTTDVAGVVRFDPGPELVVVGVSKTLDVIPLGSHWPLEDLFAPTRVLRTGRPARVDESDLRSAGGPVAEFLVSERYLTQVASPIVVEGQLWGAVSVNTRESLPADTEERLEKFTQLIATAISNAEARDSLRRLADEQAALRRVATLVAEGTAPADLFAAVAVEVAAVVGVSSGSVSRFLPDGSSVVLASHNDPGFPVGSRWRPDEGTINAAVLDAARPARVDQKVLSGPIAEASRVSDVRSAVAAPIMVEGSVWGMVAVGRQHSDEPLPQHAETRLAAFTELIATAIANAESHEALATLAEEQAALRRVATLVARESLPVELFAAVTEEAARVLDAEAVGMLRFEPGGTATLLALSNTPWDPPPLGTRFVVDGENVVATVLRTGKAARVDERGNATGSIAAMAESLGVRSCVATPIVVAGQLWGAMIAATSQSDPLPAETESRITQFIELVATAISNSEARDELSRLVEEQAALQRVATLVARDVPSSVVFEAVAEEVGKLLDTDITIVGRYDDDGAATSIGNWSASPGGVPVGTRSVLGGRNVLTMVAETGKPARMDGYEEASGEAAEIARRHGWRSSIAAPIVVEGRLWGVMLVATQRPEPFPADAEERLAAFTDLIATAIGNAQAHDEVRRFGNEQAALGRVATLVAAGADPEQVFTTVVEEVSRLVGLDRIELVRYDGDAAGTVIASSGDHPFPAGSRWSLEDPSVMATVARTGRAARIDDYSALTGEIAGAARGAGFQSAIGAPITVEGHVWGVIIAISTEPEPIPDRSETRLAHFTELVATALANAESRAEVERLANEQAALRRVATLVARGVPPEQVFAAAAQETGQLFEADLTFLGRYEEESAVNLGSWTSWGDTLPVGTRTKLGGRNTMTLVAETGKPLRIDDYDDATGEAAGLAVRFAIRCSIATPIMDEGRVWGILMVGSSRTQPFPPGSEHQLAAFTELVATAIANAESRSELAASRRRIVAASDDTRRRIERDLHDGTQQRLVSLGLAVRAAEASLPPERDDLRAELSDVAMGLAAAVEDLQEISRGIHPAILSKGGLGPALQTLAHRSVIPVDLDVTTDTRFPEPIEVAAYFVASEALANAAKHSQATRIDLALEQRDSTLVLCVRDDGVGGADAGGGSGLVGLRDRVEALGGTITVDSPRGNGTRITAELPVEQDARQPT